MRRLFLWSTGVVRFRVQLSNRMASESSTKHEVFGKIANEKGEFVRKSSDFRNFVTADGSSGFPAERDRYHLYVSLACPWAHRTLICRKLKGLEDSLPVTVVDWLLLNKGWEFTDKKPKCSLDPLYGFKYVREFYFKAEPAYTGRFTVPVLWDKKQETICNNESAEIIRMLNTEFNEFCATPEQKALDLYPAELRQEINDYNSWIYDQVNNGVYKCGFATTQTAYDKHIIPLFDALDRLEKILESRRFLCGDRLTEADVRLFTTLVRFDMVYVGHFKCNRRRIMDYPNLWGYTRDIYQYGGIGDTVDAQHIQWHYQQSHTQINPHGIVAIGPDLDFSTPHGRDKKFGK